MIEFAPCSARLPEDEAWLFCVTCTHDNKYDWFYYETDDGQLKIIGSTYADIRCAILYEVTPARIKDV